MKTFLILALTALAFGQTTGKITSNTTATTIATSPQAQVDCTFTPALNGDVLNLFVSCFSNSKSIFGANIVLIEGVDQTPALVYNHKGNVIQAGIYKQDEEIKWFVIINGTAKTFTLEK